MKEVQTVSVEVVAADELVPYDKNARVHSAEQIKASIREFGFTNPILADGDEIVAGHGRRAAVLSIPPAKRSTSPAAARCRPEPCRWLIARAGPRRSAKPT